MSDDEYRADIEFKIGASFIPCGSQSFFCRINDDM